MVLPSKCLQNNDGRQEGRKLWDLERQAFSKIKMRLGLGQDGVSSSNMHNLYRSQGSCLAFETSLSNTRQRAVP